MITQLPANTQGRDWIIGDLHGELSVLESLLETVHFDPSRDRLISVGDLIDRGRDSAGVLRMYDRSPWFHGIHGNHESMCVLANLDDEADFGPIWSANGGGWFYNLKSGEQSELLRIISSLAFCIEIKLPDGSRVGVIHGELLPGHTWRVMESFDPLEATKLWYEESGDYAPIWGRERANALLEVIDLTESLGRVEQLASVVKNHPIYRQGSFRQYFAPVSGIDRIVSGHTPMESMSGSRLPVTAGNTSFIDTGCGYAGGILTAVDVFNRCYAQASRGRRPSGIVHAPRYFESYW